MNVSDYIKNRIETEAMTQEPSFEKYSITSTEANQNC